jgi:hypothetical protein
MSQPIRVKRVRVGDDVETYCGRCKAERTHLVASMSSDTQPAEVICRTCNNKHRFRRPADASGPARPPRAASPEGGARRGTRKAEAEQPPPDARPYSPSEPYAEGEWIEHKTHGFGKIKAVRGTKIDVSFGSGLRTLVHAG